MMKKRGAPDLPIFSIDRSSILQTHDSIKRLPDTDLDLKKQSFWYLDNRRSMAMTASVDHLFYKSRTVINSANRNRCPNG